MNASNFVWAALLIVMSVSPVIAEDDETKPTPGTKAISQINTGTGLTGGPIITTGTISVATGGITSSLIADGTIGLADINQIEVQRRIATGCADGSAFSAVLFVGAPSCQPTGRGLAVLGAAGSRDPAVTTMLSGGVPTGNPIVAYVNSAGKLEVATCGSNSCKTTSTPTNPDSTASASDINATTSSTGPVLVYRGSVGGPNQIRITVCADTFCSSSTSTAIENNSQFTSSIGVAMGTDGFPILSYYSDTAQLRVAKCSNANCTSSTKTTVDATLGSGDDSDIAVTSGGLPIIAYSDSVDVRLATCGNASCSSGNSISTIGTLVTGFDVQIALIDGTSPLVAYSKLIPPAGFQVTHVASGITSVIESGSTIGGSLAIGADGAPVMSYKYIVDNTSGINANDLRVARCKGVMCNSGASVTSARAGSTMATTSLAIAADGLPVVAFENDAATDNIGFVNCGSPSCF